MSKNKNKTKYGNYIKQVGYLDIRQKMVLGKWTKNFKGEKILVKLKRAVNGKRTIKGRISKVEESLIELEVHGEVISVLFENIKKANLQREIKV